MKALSPFRKLAIKDKLIRLIMLISFFAVFMTSLLSAAYEIYLLKNSASLNIRLIASVIATNSTAAVAFNDQNSASDILSALDADPNIELSAIYLGDKTLFAKHNSINIDYRISYPQHIFSKGEFFLFEQSILKLEVFHPIIVNKKEIGSLFIRSNLNSEKKRLISFLVAMLIVMIVISIIVYFVASKLQNLITTPLQKLSDAAGLIAKNKDYSIRVSQPIEDEVGIFISAFNQMLTVIQSHDKELHEHRRLLSFEVEQRTKELAAERDNALAATKAKSQFLANMSHEIRTPLNAMIGMLSLLENSELPETAKYYLQTAITSSNNLLYLINDILDYSKIEAGKLSLEHINFDLVELITDVSNLFINAAKEKKITLSFSVDDAITAKVNGDPMRIRQILYNLISNAVKFTTHGDISLTATLRQKGEYGETIKFSVQDTGIGIEEIYQSHIFDAFSQLDGSTTRKYGGTGLGLAVCKQLVDLMDGTIDFNSEIGHGTEFWFTLTLNNITTSPDILTPPNKAGLNLNNEKLKGEILLVDDDLVNQEVTQAMLNTIGLTADLASNGHQALLKAKQTNFHLILMDCQMPIMDGYEATRQIHRMQKQSGKPTTPIVGLTANAMPEDRQKCLDCGMQTYLIKPIRLNNFIEFINKNLKHAQSSCDFPRLSQPKYDSDDDMNMTENKLWNPHLVLSEMQQNVALLNQVINIFLKQCPVHMANIEQALNNKDMEALYLAAHSLKGAAANFQCQPINRLILQLEQNAKAGNQQQAKLCLQQLLPELKKLNTELQDFQA